MIERTRREHLIEGDSLYHMLVDSVWDYAIFGLDDDGRVISWNPGGERILGYPKAEALGRRLSEFFISKDRDGGKPSFLLERAVTEGRVEEEDWRVRRDGTIFWAHAVTSVLRSAEGAVIGFSNVIRDLTDRVETHQSLTIRERQLADAQKLAGLGSWEWDVESDRVSWSDELYRIYQLDPQTFDATFEAYLGLVHPDDRVLARTTVEDAFTTGEPFEFEERIVRPDGSVRVLLSRGRALHGRHGRVVRLTGACVDITELRAAEEKAVRFVKEQADREAAEALVNRLRYLVESSELLASSLDYDETLQRVADLGIPALADWSVVDLLQENGSLIRHAVTHRDAEKRERASEYSWKYPPRKDPGEGAWKVVQTGVPEHYPDLVDFISRFASDTERLSLLQYLGISSVVIVPLVGHSAPLGALTLVQAEPGRRLGESDVWVARELGRQAGLAIENARFHRELVVQNQRLEDQSIELSRQAAILEGLLTVLESRNKDLQQRTAEAEEANRAKSDFLAAMSHDLRTPLNAIFGYADLVQMGLHGPVTEKQYDALDRIKRNQRSLLSLVNDVLNYSRLEAGKLEIIATDVEVEQIMEDIDTVVSPQIAAKGLTYRCYAPPGLTVHGEKDRIEQILLNLIANAIKFTPSGGRVTINVSAAEGGIQFDVTDTGIGIPLERHGVIFDPFVQIDRGGDPVDRGVGLGLAISRNLARAMEGSLTVESAPEIGSTFTLTLPAGRGDASDGDGRIADADTVD